MNFVSRKFYFKEKRKPLVIAEVGVNHNGDVKIAKKMVDVARGAGADIVKLQLFYPQKEISIHAKKALYQQRATSKNDGRTQLELANRLALRPRDIQYLHDYCRTITMPFLCTAFEKYSMRFLVDELRVRSIKLPSSEITNLPFLEEVGSKKIGVILSTGASTLPEVAVAVKTLKRAGCPELILLHCVSQYPAPYDQMNLRAIATMRKAFKVPVGLSDHTLGIIVSVVAIALGAVAIEKHFTLDRTMKGPDHQASIEPDELSQLVRSVNIAYQALGTGKKVVTSSERTIQKLIRKSVVTGLPLTKGTKLTTDNLEIKRPAGGIEPRYFTKMLNRRIRHDLPQDHKISWNDLEK